MALFNIKNLTLDESIQPESVNNARSRRASSSGNVSQTNSSMFYRTLKLKKCNNPYADEKKLKLNQLIINSGINNVNNLRKFKLRLLTSTNNNQQTISDGTSTPYMVSTKKNESSHRHRIFSACYTTTNNNNNYELQSYQNAIQDYQMESELNQWTRRNNESASMDLVGGGSNDSQRTTVLKKTNGQALPINEEISKRGVNSLKPRFIND